MKFKLQVQSTVTDIVEVEADNFYEAAKQWTEAHAKTEESQFDDRRGRLVSMSDHLTWIYHGEGPTDGIDPDGVFENPDALGSDLKLNERGRGLLAGKIQTVESA